MDSDNSELSWGVAQRLEFIEFRLFWEGHVNRSDVMENFGLSVNQGSANLSRYIGLVPRRHAARARRAHPRRLQARAGSRHLRGEPEGGQL